MCSVFGAVTWNQDNLEFNAETNRILDVIYRTSHQRGRDGRGYTIQHNGHRDNHRDTATLEAHEVLGPPAVWPEGNAIVIGNTRAEPTTEYVQHKHIFDQQPYGVGEWQAVHNGTIANDKVLRELAQGFLEPELHLSTKIDSAAIVEMLESQNIIEASTYTQFADTIKSLKGSYAILAAHGSDDRSIFVAANYRPIWYIMTQFGVFFASCRDYFPVGYVPEMVQPYSIMQFEAPKDGGKLNVHKELLNPPTIERHRALVVCSGGLDSVVSATIAKKVLNHHVELIHFVYGSRAEGPEIEAIRAVAHFLEVPLHIKQLPMWDKEDSNLLQSDGVIAGGEEGAEFAHEWVPARNLVMLAVATAFAEAKGFKYIVLGNNLEEAGAYPDNEPEFIARFNDLLPFAVGDGKKVTVVMPVGNMMKHEIVEWGNRIGAPMHLTWSCYRAGKLHCGTCGPCFMRRTAFKINNLDEVISYEV
jgi:7-cyano-7-deazaguanine synthase